MQELMAIHTTSVYMSYNIYIHLYNMYSSAHTAQNRVVVRLQGCSCVLQQGGCEAGITCASGTRGGRSLAGAQPSSGKGIHL